MNLLEANKMRAALTDVRTSVFALSTRLNMLEETVANLKKMMEDGFRLTADGHGEIKRRRTSRNDS